MLKTTPYFMRYNAWFYYDIKEHKFKLTKDAPIEAIQSYKEFYGLYEEDEEFDSDEFNSEEFDSDEFFQEVYEDALQHMDSVVHHPKHYNQYGDLEVIDIIAEATKNMQGDKGYVFGNILKYLLRAPFKGKFEEDVAKANWYWKYYKNGGKGESQ